MEKEQMIEIIIDKAKQMDLHEIDMLQYAIFRISQMELEEEK